MSNKAIRVIGGLVAAIGACGAAGTAFSLLFVEDDAQMHFWIGTGLAYCVLLTAAGIGIWMLKSWGFLLLLAVAVLLVVLPSITTLAGFTRFAFEPPGVIDTICYLAVAIASWFGYRRLEQSPVAP